MKRRITRPGRAPFAVVSGGAAALVGIGMISIGVAQLAGTAGAVPVSPAAMAASQAGGVSEYSSGNSTRALDGTTDDEGAIAVAGNLTAGNAAATPPTALFLGAFLNNTMVLAVGGNVSGNLAIMNTGAGNFGVYGGSDSATQYGGTGTPTALYPASSTYPLPDFQRN